MHRRARQQRRVDLERRVLGGRADEGEEARLDVRQEGVLLRLVEAVHLVDEEHRARGPAACARLRALDRLADVLDAAEHRRDRDELGVEGLAPSAAPASSCRRPAGPTGSSNAAGPIRTRRAAACPAPSRCCWPIDVVERARPQALGERRLRAGAVAAARRTASFSGWLSPSDRFGGRAVSDPAPHCSITSAPGGAVK